MKLPNFEPKLFKWHSFLELNQRCDFLKFRALQDSKPQTQDPKSGALSIREGFNKKEKKYRIFYPPIVLWSETSMSRPKILIK